MGLITDGLLGGGLPNRGLGFGPVPTPPPPSGPGGWIISRGLGFGLLVTRGLARSIPSRQARDADVIDAIIAALKATRAFDDVAWGEEPERWGRGAEKSALAVVEPSDWGEIDEWDDEPGADGLGYSVKSTFTLTIHVRNPDPRTRDRKLDYLLNVAKNAIDGNGFGGLVVNDLTILRRGKYSPARNPERRMTIVGEYSYLVDGSSDHATDK